MKNLILLSFFLPFKSHKGVNLPFGENGEGSYYDKCNSSEAHLSWCALKHTKSSSSIITSPIPLSRFLLGIFKSKFQNSKCHWMD